MVARGTKGGDGAAASASASASPSPSPSPIGTPATQAAEPKVTAPAQKSGGGALEAALAGNTVKWSAGGGDMYAFYARDSGFARQQGDNIKYGYWYVDVAGRLCEKVPPSFDASKSCAAITLDGANLAWGPTKGLLLPGNARNLRTPTRREELLKRLTGNSIAWKEGDKPDRTHYYHSSGAMPRVITSGRKDWFIWRIDEYDRVELLWSDGDSHLSHHLSITGDGSDATLLPHIPQYSIQLLPGNPKQLTPQTRGGALRAALAGNSVDWEYFGGKPWRRYFAPDGRLGDDVGGVVTKDKTWWILFDELQMNETKPNNTPGPSHRSPMLVAGDTITWLKTGEAGKILRGNAFNL